MNARSRFTTLAAFMLIAGLLLAACGPENATPTTSAVPATATSSAPGAATNTPAGEEAPATPTSGEAAAPTATEAGPSEAALPTPTLGQGAKTMTFALPSEPSTADPQKIAFVEDYSWAVLGFEGLLELTKDNQAVPAAAKEVAVSDDGLQYTLTLEDDLKYSDGSPLTAHDFEYGWRRLFDPTVADRGYASVAYIIAGSQELSELEDINDTAQLEQLQANLGVKALDDTHIQFTLREPAAYFPYILTLWVGWPVPQEMIEQHGDGWTEPGTYIGNGPYVLKQWNHGSNGIWEANEFYRKGRPKIDRMDVRFITESTIAFEAYKAGELDWLDTVAEDMQQIQTEPGLMEELVQVPGICTTYLGFNVTKAPFDNPQVRQAFVQAMDREDWVEVVERGLTEPATNFIPTGMPGHYPDIQQPEFDPDAAMQTLEAAGGAGALPEIKLAYASSDRATVNMQWVQGQLQTNLGVTVVLDPIEARAFTELFNSLETTPALFLLGWCQDYPDPQDWLSLVWRSDSTQNFGGWANDEFDQLTREADTLSDAGRRDELYKQAHQILIDEAAAVFLSYNTRNVLIKPYLSGMREFVNSAPVQLPGLENVVNMDIQK